MPRRRGQQHPHTHVEKGHRAGTPGTSRRPHQASPAYPREAVLTAAVTFCFTSCSRAACKQGGRDSTAPWPHSHQAHRSASYPSRPVLMAVGDVARPQLGGAVDPGGYRDRHEALSALMGEVSAVGSVWGVECCSIKRCACVPAGPTNRKWSPHRAAPDHIWAGDKRPYTTK